MCFGQNCVCSILVKHIWHQHSASLWMKRWEKAAVVWGTFFEYTVKVCLEAKNELIWFWSSRDRCDFIQQIRKHNSRINQLIMTELKASVDCDCVGLTSLRVKNPCCSSWSIFVGLKTLCTRPNLHLRCHLKSPEAVVNCPIPQISPKRPESAVSDPSGANRAANSNCFACLIPVSEFKKHSLFALLFFVFF